MPTRQRGFSPFVVERAAETRPSLAAMTSRRSLRNRAFRRPNIPPFLHGAPLKIERLASLAPLADGPFPRRRRAVHEDFARKSYAIS